MSAIATTIEKLTATNGQPYIKITKDTNEYNLISGNINLRYFPRVDDTHLHQYIIDAVDDTGDVRFAYDDVVLPVTGSPIALRDWLQDRIAELQEEIYTSKSGNLLLAGILAEVQGINLDTNGLATSLANIDANTDNIEPLLTAGNVNTASILTAVNAINLNTDTLEALITTSNTKLTNIDANTDTLEALVTTSNTNTLLTSTNTTTIKNDTALIKADIATIKTDTATIKTDQVIIKNDTALIKAAVQSIDNDTSTLIQYADLQYIEVRPWRSQIDYSNPAVIYMGQAKIGEPTANASWRISRITDTGSDFITEWANGAAWDQVWDNRASLSYS